MQFDFLNKYKIESKTKIDLFWSTINGNQSSGSPWYLELLNVLLLLLSFNLPLIGLINLIDRITKKQPLILLDQSFYFGIPSEKNIVLVSFFLWVLFFLVSIYIAMRAFNTVSRESNTKMIENTWTLSKKFSASETTAFSSLKVSEELEIYAKATMPSDMGLGADYDFIGAKYYYVLTGRRCYGQYSEPNILSNSFFASLENNDDVLNRLELYSWYPKNEASIDRIVPKLFQLNDLILKNSYWRDCSLGATAYKALSQTFLAAHFKEKSLFNDFLNETIILFEQYSKTRKPLKGLPRFTIMYGPKIILICGTFGTLVLLALVLSLAPAWIVNFSSKKFDTHWKVEDVKDVIQNCLVLLGLVIAVRPYFKGSSRANNPKKK